MTVQAVMVYSQCLLQIALEIRSQLVVLEHLLLAQHPLLARQLLPLFQWTTQQLLPLQQQHNAIAQVSIPVVLLLVK